MPRFNAHIGYQFTEFSPLDRFRKAAECGFSAVEWPAIYPYPAQRLRDLLDQCGLQWVQVTLPFGDTNRGEKGLAALPGREDEFRTGLDQSIAYAKALGAKWIHPMAGVVSCWDDSVRKTYVGNMKRAVKQAADNGLGTLVEVIWNGEVPGYGLDSYARAEEMIDAIGDPSPQLILDTYHAQNITGNLFGLLAAWSKRIGHVQVADVPGRHEPGTGRIEFDRFFRELDQSGYTGWVGGEYKPLGATCDGLHFLRRHGHPGGEA